MGTKKLRSQAAKKSSHPGQMTMKAKRIHLMISIFFFFPRKELGKRDQRLELKIVSSIFDTKFFKSDAKKVFFLLP